MKRGDLLEALSTTEMSRLLSIAEEIELPKGSQIFSPGSPVTSIFIIERGRVKLCKLSQQNKSLVIALLGPGELIGEGIWEAGFHEYEALALDDTALYEIPLQAFEGLLRSYPDLGLRFIQLFGLRLRDAHNRIEDIVLRPVPGRVARLILGMADAYGKVTPGGIKVDFRLTHQDIADLVGSSRVTATQVLNRFRADGLIEMETKRVTILNRDALEALLEDGLSNPY